MLCVYKGEASGVVKCDTMLTQLDQESGIVCFYCHWAKFLNHASVQVLSWFCIETSETD